MLKAFVITAISALAIPSAFSQTINPTEWSDVRPSASVSVSPSSEPGMYLVRAKVTDLKSSKLLANPELKTTLGTPATFELGIQGKIIIKFVVTINESGQEASYVTEVRRNGELESSQEMSLSLAKRG